MFEILAKFFKFSGEENSKKFKLSIGIGLVEALASAMKIPAIMYILTVSYTHLTLPTKLL